MAKITWTDKTDLHSPWDEEYQYTAGNVNETKQSVNDLYDIVGAGTVSDNLIVVSINTGGATNKIKDTLDAITDSSENKPYMVEVRPGSGLTAYVEDNFTIPQYVSLVSIGGITTTQIQATLAAMARRRGPSRPGPGTNSVPLLAGWASSSGVPGREKTS